MKKTIGIIILLVLLGYGIIRIGVGIALSAQASEIVNFPELAEAVEEVNVFIGERASKQVIPFSATGYFAYILSMGILLSAGAIFVFLRKNTGFVILWIYVALHAALFINYLEINPKLFVLALQVILVFTLRRLRPPLLPSNS